MFRKKKIDEWALDYWLLQQYARLCFRIYYRKIEVVNRQNIPDNQPVILTPNHQNALMDAMVLVCNTGKQNVFLARADIFKSKWLIRFLTFANIMPIYRIRDGIENVKRNDKVFEKTLDVLHNKLNPLGIFPEGNHGDRRRLRQLVKGLFRIAFQAQEKYGDQPGVKIVPIGIDYGHYQHFRTTLFVNVGKPIEVSEFYPAYRLNPVNGINMLKERFAGKLSGQMIDIQTEAYYELFMELRGLFNDEMRKILDIPDKSLSGRFRADKVMIDRLNLELEKNPESIGALNNLMMRYQEGLRRAGLRDWVVKKNTYPVAGLLLGVIAALVLLPVFIAGLINNYLPYWFAGSRVKNLKDPQFHSSFKYVIGMIAFPLWYLVLAIVLIFFPLPAIVKLVYILLFPVTGLFAFGYYIRMKKLVALIRYSLYNRKPEITNLKNMRGSILERMYEIVNRHSPVHENSR
ncbi:MAG TPA: 1-acyl-sn-glycerol-3-phosphate acyltransferase [Bacteroidales bacterium]|nr:1-acyl-sn-glycerol-3-phosphate acyltransferase [Bacteroidales bacterium]